MKMLLSITLALAFGLSSFTQETHAASASAKSYHIKFSTSNVSDSAWTEFVASTAKAVKQITVFSTSENPIDIGVGDSGEEEVHVTVPQGTLPGAAYSGSPVGVYTAAPMVLDLRIQSLRRIALRCKNSTCGKGEFQMNLIYQ